MANVNSIAAVEGFSTNAQVRLVAYQSGRLVHAPAGAVGLVSQISPTTDNAIVRFDGASGQLQDSGVTLDDAGVMSPFTSTGIDDNATGERVQIADALLMLGTAGAGYTVAHADDDQAIEIVGGNASASGGGLLIVGQNHASLAGDVFLRTGSNNNYQWDESALQHIFYRGLIDARMGQIKFPATQNASSDANTLDDYEEQTFTPTIVGTTAAGVGTYTTQNGRRTKIGRMVFVEITLVWTAHTGTGNMEVGGLPDTGGGVGGAVSVVFSSITFAGVSVTGFVSGANIALRNAPTTGNAVTALAMDTAGTLIISGFYSV